MKVKELIEGLEKFDEEKEICIMKLDLEDNYYQDDIGYIKENGDTVEIY